MYIEQIKFGVIVESPLSRRTSISQHLQWLLIHSVVVLCFANVSRLIESWFTIYPFLAPRITDATILYQRFQTQYFSTHNNTVAISSCVNITETVNNSMPYFFHFICSVLHKPTTQLLTLLIQHKYKPERTQSSGQQILLLKSTNA